MKKIRRKFMRKKRAFRRKAIRKRIRSIIPYSRPDGHHKGKFTYINNIQRGASNTLTQFFINWNTNIDGTGIDVA